VKVCYILIPAAAIGFPFLAPLFQPFRSTLQELFGSLPFLKPLQQGGKMPFAWSALCGYIKAPDPAQQFVD
jgi:hypothetical protein